MKPRQYYCGKSIDWKALCCKTDGHLELENGLSLGGEPLYKKLKFLGNIPYAKKKTTKYKQYLTD